ncbi:MAG: hypothetical protein ACRDYA_00355 [Egibacteraceae bacterium]
MADEDTQEGPAVLGEAEVMCWTPCHHRAVRIKRSVLRQRPFTAECPRCGEIWRVGFRWDRDGVELLAVWAYGPYDRL